MSEVSITEPAEEYSFDCDLPIDGSDLSPILEMGIEFGPFGEGDKWRPARLPIGWCFKKLNNQISVILDHMGNTRITIYLREKIHMRPQARFYHGRDMYDKNFDTNARFCVWDRRQGDKQSSQVVFERNYGVPSAKRDRQVHDSKVNSYRSSRDCERWLEENYPNWGNYNAYWEEGPPATLARGKPNIDSHGE